MDYSLYFNDKVNSLIDYLKSNNIKAMILGISGGIDSTVVAAICYEVSILTGVPLIGRSLPTKYNKKGETTTADLVGKAFCNDFQTFNIGNMYENVLNELVETSENQTSIANGNIQARLRMIYLYNLASIHKGIVMDTDNLTEHNLGYWTLHGDVGDVCLLHDLWKTQVFKLAEYLYNYYTKQLEETFNFKEPSTQDLTNKANSIALSLKLKPTAGLGITNNDLEELGAESYKQVDDILQEILAWKSFTLETSWNLKNFLDDQQMLNIPIEIIKNVATRHFNSEFKRKYLPIKI
jgi:NAD+ synthetase